MKTRHPIQSFSLVAALLLPALHAQAADPIALPSAPLYLAGGVAPNLTVTLDDSGSMAWGYVPDSMGKNAKVTDGCGHSIFSGYDGSETKRYFLSGDYNAQYYNPSTTYLPPLKSDGTPYTTSYGSAYTNGFDTSSTVVNLASAYQPSFGFQPKSNQCYAKHPALDSGSGKQFSSDTVNVPAYYYSYDPVGTACASPSKTTESCYVYTAVGAAQQQNFANWYSFYRTRNLATVSAATRAFNNLPGTMRLAWQALNSSCDDFSGTSCAGWDDTKINNSIRALSSSHKQNFFKWLEKLPANGSTPLRLALGRVGEYYRTSTAVVNSPYAEDPQVTVGTQHSCRANYTIMMTDGIWNGNNASEVSGNVDNTAKSLPDGTSYSPSAPFKDDNSNSLADVAFYYWAKDLRTDLTNNVPRSPRALDKLVEDGKTIPTADYFDPKNDPASWQHMVTYTVGLGLTATLPELTPALTWAGDTYTGSYADLASGTLSPLWPVTGTDKPGNVADLWHAAINGRGLFFSAEDPQSLSDAMQEMVNNIISRSSSAASIATNSKKLDTSTAIYQASFDSGNWTGELEAFAVKSDGALGDSLWKASTKIPAEASRNIKTFNGSVGVDFAWGSISADQQVLVSEDELNYLRGDQSKEQNKGGTFRTRTSLLGDIVNSDPLFVSEENFGYDKLSGDEGTFYVDYVVAKSSKTPMIYVGANDGMLHAFKASDGGELFAYVPGLIYANLPSLTKPNYSHKYYVDGAPAVGDVFYGGSAWRTVLVTPLGAGGRGVFALDVSTPDAAFSESNVLWEFDGENAAAGSTLNDMGYPVGGATIGRFNDGKYYAVFGNGYGSANCKSGLFMVQIDAPSNVKFFDTGEGACTTSATQNGMSTPSLVDYDGDRIIDAIYAGDLQGKLWKWDVTSATNSVWDFAAGGQPMFTTASGQPITAPVEVGKVPSGLSGEAMVYFGTGRYLLSGDEASKTKQAFYGLLDNGTAIPTTGNPLVEQTIVYESANARVVSSNTVSSPKRGWYLDLVPPSGTLQGERVLSVPLLRFGRVIFNTSIPSADPCVLGGTGWLMELDAATGGNLTYSALDMDSDGLFNEGDYVVIGQDKDGNDIKSPVAGKASGSMSLNQPTVITAGSKEYKFNSDIKKGISVTTEKSGTSNPRSSWRQLQ
ncbi:MAG TPA: PilC/PilY family type IV pilus protein [Thiobacillus sp.]|nr:MAG: hypothetical protein B7Y27_08210 [Hydrogenophilales bacterium 16-64-40]OZA34620.1 MAG: hypothetical protein B7X82_04740 [Hydrogenophilales bacterium 17-64-65]HQS82298.1 PilC/PilY family type IV pilus protein [Thiobacillus sp.]HQT33574.1 PilC/PilY family type IV pilus protein [Thiobacillus sp.]